MSVIAVALVVTALFCLPFPATRWIGVALAVLGAVLLFYLHPLLSTLLLVGACVAVWINWYLTVKHERKTIHELPQLPDRGD